MKTSRRGMAADEVPKRQFAGSCGGQREEEGGTAGNFAFCADGAGMSEPDVLSDGESEAGASGFTGAGFIDPVKAFKQAPEVLGGDAGAEITNIEFDAGLGSTRAQLDACTGAAVLHGVVDQVGKDLVDGFAVGEDWGERLQS